VRQSYSGGASSASFLLLGTFWSKGMQVVTKLRGRITIDQDLFPPVPNGTVGLAEVAIEASRYQASVN